jgi:hypothetical protein
MAMCVRELTPSIELSPDGYGIIERSIWADMWRWSRSRSREYVALVSQPES